MPRRSSERSFGSRPGHAPANSSTGAVSPSAASSGRPAPPVYAHCSRRRACGRASPCSPMSRVVRGWQRGGRHTRDSSTFGNETTRPGGNSAGRVAQMGELEGYLRSLAGKGNEGTERGPTAVLLRRVTTPGLRFRGKLAVTALMRPVARRRARQLATRADLLLVNLGSGSRPVDGWKNVDLAGMGADLAWDLRRALPFPPGSVDGVLLEHVLEHFTAAEALALVSRVHAVLKPGGVLRASVPDFGRYMQSYAGDAQFVHQNRPE